ncbi:hypothetical protein [Haloferula sp. BvORR071]|uniref:hypothetical protein n=1 Tax=Haloferula sp. BvORR071 TaxID=1396141 RepID=UPI000555FEE8|nr:hypothetical protein [Haloferula sp. BvORR071]
MTARDNPFAPARLARVLGFDPALNGSSWEELEAKWERLGRRAAVTGQHGAGKTSLLAAWAQRSEAKGDPVIRLFFNEQHCQLQDPDRDLLGECVGKLVLLDGDCHLSWWQQRELHRLLRPAAGVLAARHRRGPWPELLRLEPGLELAKILLNRAFSARSGPWSDNLPERWRRHRGNLRELWLELYDEAAEFPL